MLKLNNILYIETYGDKSKVVNPKIPYKVYQCNLGILMLNLKK